MLAAKTNASRHQQAAFCPPAGTWGQDLVLTQNQNQLEDYEWTFKVTVKQLQVFVRIYLRKRLNPKQLELKTGAFAASALISG